MPIEIVTPARLAKHVLYQTEHRKWERRYHGSRDLLLAALEGRLTYSVDAYSLIVKPQTRLLFNQKLFRLDHPDQYEQYLQPTASNQLVVTGPPAARDLEDDVDDLRGMMAKYLSPAQEEVLKRGHPPAEGYVRSLIAERLGPDEELLTS